MSCIPDGLGVETKQEMNGKDWQYLKSLISNLRVVSNQRKSIKWSDLNKFQN